MSNNPEQITGAQETSYEINKSAQEQLERLQDKEKTIEIPSDTAEKQINEARKEIAETVISVEADSKKSEHTQSLRRGPISKKQSDESYKKIMSQVQNELSPVSRSFSKVIHNKTIERTSEIIGATIARPNAILAGAFVAFLVTLLTYTVAKTIGYPLSGLETISAFIVGWVLGVIYDYLKVIITGKKS